MMKVFFLGIKFLVSTLIAEISKFFQGIAACALEIYKNSEFQ